jgi:hypothetical protein
VTSVRSQDSAIAGSPAIAAANALRVLDLRPCSTSAAGLGHPGRFTRPVVFRRCPRCAERNLVRDGLMVCAVCDADLPQRWNLG